MSYSNLVKKGNKIVLTVIITVLASFLFSESIYADSISPFLTEDILSTGERSKHSFTYSNENDYDVFVTPRIYKYYPQSEQISEAQPFEELVIIDTDYIQIPSKSEKKLTFQIVASQALEPGTYYNLILLEQSTQREEDKAAIGTTGALSHLIRLHITKGDKGDQITDQYNSSIEVVHRGIPFIKPTKIKFTFFNNSTYTLIPKGEIQVIKRSADKQPEYFKINTSRDRVFPEESYEEEFVIQNWYIEDILFGKTAYLRIQNGIDDSVRKEEIKIPGFRGELLYILATITVTILLATSLKGDTKPEPEFAE